MYKSVSSSTGRGKEHVVDADDPLLVQRDVIDERGAAMEREVQRMVQVVIQVRARADDEIHQAAVHHLDHAAADAGRRHGARDGQADGRVFVGIEHLLRKDAARFGQTGGVERLKSLVNQVTDFLAAFRTIKTDWLAGKCALRSGGAWMTIRHRV